ncbi:ATP synthase F0 subcomplex A subunit [Mariniphaga anaerophila]|uniref:ATP synthase subunit a n=1 Tax=Mariniphaga anaerophila TaxID=1484053 RepID=A0A1M5CSD5_9BACT|nr:F0F1 ATP synthase subunit A [Mariniphaga anaerophila]SHF57262.1 ATP synthase F0 subcomplex A subunit [Mariniphaga anaerophila]
MFILDKRWGLLLTFILTVFWVDPLIARGEEAHGSYSGEKEHAEEKFDAGHFVIEHVLDAYEWHIASVGETHITVPLPVILFSRHPELHEGKKLHVFMSSKFHHGHDDYMGFRISASEKNKGKIVELDNQGQELGKPLDLSITKTITGVLVSVVVLFSLLFAAVRTAKHNRGKAPSGVQNLIEPVIVFIRDEIAKPSIGEKKYKKFMPPLLTLFFFILLNNLLGLIPIFPFGANVTGNIAITMVLALFTFFVTNLRGNKHYWKEIFNPDVPMWLKIPIPLMPLLEISGMITKPFVLMVRLFANMLAGHLIVTVFLSLIFIFSSLMGPIAGYGVSPVSVLFAVFIMLLDVLVSFIQAYVFTLLSAIYFGMATAEHH